jgi:hypothetical protein
MTINFVGRLSASVLGPWIKALWAGALLEIRNPNGSIEDRHVALRVAAESLNYGNVAALRCAVNFIESGCL